jgi:MYXO-CTERM domain-containing protein
MMPGSRWSALDFFFAIPANAIGDGKFHVFAGGDLNNLGTDRIDVEAGPFLGSTTLGTFSFPISNFHFTACEKPVHQNTSPCPVPETVPGGRFQNPNLIPVGAVQGRRVTRSSIPGIPGIPGLIVPQELLVADTNLQISLFPRSIGGIFDLYIDRLELRFDTAASPVPEPPTSSLVALGLAALALGFAARRQRG